jgi:hypothetical protein
MNREIKFRAWDKIWKTIHSSESLNMEGVFLDVETGQFHHKDLRLCYHWLTPLQYTGLKDINGVEIYEGDIVDCWHGIGTIAFNNRNFAGLPAFHVCGESLSFYYGVAADAEAKVIGNIYENPELLENLK